MQKYATALSYEGYTITQYINIVKSALERLQWEYSEEGNTIYAKVKATAFSWGEEVEISVFSDDVWISSCYRFWSVGKHNKRNVEALVREINVMCQQQALISDSIFSDSTSSLFKDNESAIYNTDTTYLNTAANRGYWCTFTLSILMVVIFLVMSISGVSLLEPTAHDIIIWGGNFFPLTMEGEYWRLLSSVLVHIGLPHIVFNIYALLNIGFYLEPSIGKWRFLLVFILTGLISGIVSIWWDDFRVSAGASGAIFGLYGFLLIMLATSTTDRPMKNGLVVSMGIFIVLNLLYGLQENIDNAAHIGGLAGGILMGAFFALEGKAKKASRWLQLAGAGLPLLLVVSFLTFYTGKKTMDHPVTETAVHPRFQNMDSSFYSGLTAIALLDNEASWPFSNVNDKSKNQLAGEMERVSIPKWTEAAQILKDLKPGDSADVERRIKLTLTDYLQLRLQEAHLYIQQADDSAHFSPKALQQVQKKIRDLQTDFAKTWQ